MYWKYDKNYEISCAYLKLTPKYQQFLAIHNQKNTEDSELSNQCKKENLQVKQDAYVMETRTFECQSITWAIFDEAKSRGLGCRQLEQITSSIIKISGSFSFDKTVQVVYKLFSDILNGYVFHTKLFQIVVDNCNCNCSRSLDNRKATLSYTNLDHAFKMKINIARKYKVPIPL